MTGRALLLSVLLLSPAFSFAASREIQELQRDVAQLQDMVRALQQIAKRETGRADRHGAAGARRRQQGEYLGGGA